MSDVLLKKKDEAIKLHRIGEIDNAIKIYEEILSVDKNNYQIHFFLGSAYLQKNFFKLAIEHLHECVERDKKHYFAYNNLGIAHLKINNIHKAKDFFFKSLDIQSDFKDAILNLINIYKDESNYVKLIKLYKRLSIMVPQDKDINLQIGIIYNKINDYKNAILSYQKEFKIDPSKKYLKGEIINLKLKICNWDKIQEYLESALDDVSNNNSSLTPFQLLNISDDGDLMKLCAENYFNKHIIKKNIKRKIFSKNKKKIRIGYFSADFYDHATLHLMYDVFRFHNKNEFEIYIFSYGTKVKDKWSEDIKNHCYKFLDIYNFSYDEIFDLSSTLEIDIAIDLKGYTENARSELFAQRLAPLQINFLGYPGTLGNPNIDYMIADKYVIPKENYSKFTEKILCMPNCYQPNMKFKKIADNAYKREDFSLPNDKFIFCCFNNNYKYNPLIFNSWMNILKNSINSVLWLYVSNDLASENILFEAENKGISRDRIFFANNLKSKNHLRRLQLGDLFLDTYPYNAHTSASDALRMQVPLVTLSGKTFASRVAGSILSQLNLSELITNNIEEYEDLAIKLCNDKLKYLSVKKKISKNVKSTSLFNSESYTKDLEKIYFDLVKYN